MGAEEEGLLQGDWSRKAGFQIKCSGIGTRHKSGKVLLSPINLTDPNEMDTIQHLGGSMAYQISRCAATAGD